MAIVLTRRMTGGSLRIQIMSQPAAVHIVLVMVNAVVVHIRDAVGGKEVRTGITDSLRTRFLVTMSGDGFLHSNHRRNLGLAAAYPSSGTDLGFVSAFNRLVSSARGSCSRRVIGLLMSLCFVLEMTIVWRAALGVLVPGALMRPFVSLSCSREDDRLVG